MIIRFKVPFKVYIIGPSLNSLNVKSSFKHENYIVNFSFLSKDEPIKVDGAPQIEKYSKNIDHLSFEIKADESSIKGKKLLDLFEDKEKRYDLLLFLTKIVNRVLRNIRNYGMVHNIHEIKPKPNETKALLHRWDVEISKNGKEFLPIMEKPKDLTELLIIYRIGRDIPLISIPKQWIDVEEAIKEDLESPPELEFSTNAMGFLRERNNRMALLESVTCLEIILSQYLREFLEKRKGISHNKINNFLSPNLGLTNRISVILDLTLGKKKLNESNIDKKIILEGINCRNTIVHKTGHLPKNINDDRLIKIVINTLALAVVLARERYQIVAEPSLKEISKDIAKKHKIPTPTIQAFPRHQIFAQVIFLFEEIPNRNIIKEICEDLIIRLSERDGHFNRNKHLFFKFSKFPDDKTIARWQSGKLYFP